MAVEIGNWNRGGASPSLTLVAPRQAGGGLASPPGSAENSGEDGPLCWGDTTWVMGLRSIEGRIARAGQAHGDAPHERFLCVLSALRALSSQRG